MQSLKLIDRECKAKRILREFFLYLVFSMSVLQAQEYDKTQWTFLVDVSGSMKKNDPDNDRQKALEILSLIAPENLEARVLVFDDQVRELVPMGPLNELWKSNYLEKQQAVNYKGQWTHIGLALKEGLKGFSKDRNKHLILITDGLVDVSKKREMNTQERWKIFHEQLAVLQENEIKVHTLSLGSQSDLELLQVLSRATSGYYRQVDHAEEIYDYLLDLMKAGSHYEQLPLKSQEFLVDSLTQDLLILSPSENPPLLENPREEFIELHFKKAGKSFLGLLSQPEQGTWRLSGQMNKPALILAMSSLKAKWLKAPSMVLQNTPFTLTSVIEGAPDWIDGKGRCEVVVPESWKGYVLQEKKPHQCQALIIPQGQTKPENITLSYHHEFFERSLDHQVQVFPDPAQIFQRYDSKTQKWILELYPQFIFWDLQKTTMQTQITSQVKSNCQFDGQKVYRCFVDNVPSLQGTLTFILQGQSRSGQKITWKSAPLKVEYEDFSQGNENSLSQPIDRTKEITPKAIQRHPDNSVYARSLYDEQDIDSGSEFSEESKKLDNQKDLTDSMTPKEERAQQPQILEDDLFLPNQIDDSPEMMPNDDLDDEELIQPIIDENNVEQELQSELEPFDIQQFAIYQIVLLLFLTAGIFGAKKVRSRLEQSALDQLK